MSLTTLANCKAFKNVTGTAHDAELARLILVVDEFCNAHCNRKLEQATVTEYHSARRGQTVLILRQPPVASITSIHDDTERVYGSETLIAAADYVLEDADAGIVRFDGTSLQQGINNVKVVYPGGFAAGSSALKLLEQAAIELVWLTRDLGDKALLGVQAKQIADGSITTFQRSRLEAVREILDRYRLERVG